METDHYHKEEVMDKLEERRKIILDINEERIEQIYTLLYRQDWEGISQLRNDVTKGHRVLNRLVNSEISPYRDYLMKLRSQKDN